MGEIGDYLATLLIGEDNMAKSSGGGGRAGLMSLRARAKKINKATGRVYRITAGEYRGKPAYFVRGGGRGIYATSTAGDYRFTQKILSDIAKRG